MKFITFLILSCAALMAATVLGPNTFAPDYDSSSYAQYTHTESPNGGSYVDVPGDADHAYDAAISLKVAGGTKVWLTNYVSSWYWAEDLNVPFDMSAGKYGYVDGAGLHLGDGTSINVTYEKDGHSQTTKGYLLGLFEEDDTIYIAMTPRAGEDVMVDTEQDVGVYMISRQDGNGSETLADLADNVRINFGMSNGVGYEFVAVSETPVAQGQPLPGMAVSAMIALGTYCVSRRRRKDS